VPSGREQYLQALASLSELTRVQAERVAGLLAKQGEVQSAQVGRVAEDMMRRTQKNREILTRLVQREVKRQLGLLGMATRDEVARLQQRVRALEQAVERPSQTATSSFAGTSGRRARSASDGATTTTRTRAASAGSTTSRTSRAGSAGSGSSRSSTRTSRAKTAGSGTARPSTRTRTSGASSRSTASSPRTRRTGAGGEPRPPESPPSEPGPPESPPGQPPSWPEPGVPHPDPPLSGPLLGG
jgi:polyhydroxyalkanoate synthesis regulator phasin